MIVITKNLGTVEPIKYINFSIDLTNNSNVDMTILDIKNDENLGLISDYINLIVPKHSIIQLNYYLISDYNSFSNKSIDKTSSLKCLLDNTNIDINIIITYDIENDEYIYLFKIENLVLIKNILSIIIEYSSDSTNFIPPDLAIIKLDNRKIILSKRFSLSKYIFGYLFEGNDVYRKNAQNNLFILSSKSYFKIKNIYLKIL